MLKMKSCPNCDRTYSDLSLSYCLHDGSLLSAPFASDKYQLAGLDKTVDLPESSIQTFVANKDYEPSLEVTLENGNVRFGENFTLSFQRTLRIPDDGKTYPLPPGLGAFPICRISDYEDRVPSEWNRHGGIFIPMFQREALWINFDGADWRPNAVKIAAGKINAVTGKSWNQSICSEEQDYMVCPPQEWIDGFKTGTGIVRQFVAMPLGRGYTVEEQLSDSDDIGGIQVIVFDPKPGIFPDEEPGPVALRSVADTSMFSIMPENPPLFMKALEPEQEMGLAAGGKIKQKIYPDKHGAATWDEANYGRLFVHIVNSKMFEAITGLQTPTTPVSAESYARHGLPWFEIYDEHLADVPVGEELYTVKPLGLVDKIKGVLSKKEPLSITPKEVKKIKINANKIKDGDW